MKKVMYAYPPLAASEIVRLKKRVARLEKKLAPEREVSDVQARKELISEMTHLKAIGHKETDVFELHDALSLPFPQIARLIADMEEKRMIVRSE